jgi:hypothetical protein
MSDTICRGPSLADAERWCLFQSCHWTLRAGIHAGWNEGAHVVGGLRLKRGRLRLYLSSRAHTKLVSGDASRVVASLMAAYSVAPGLLLRLCRAQKRPAYAVLATGLQAATRALVAATEEAQQSLPRQDVFGLEVMQ